MLKFSFDDDNNEKFFAGIRHIGVGLALTGVIGLFFEQELPSAALAVAVGLSVLFVGSLSEA